MIKKVLLKILNSYTGFLIYGVVLTLLLMPTSVLAQGSKTDSSIQAVVDSTSMNALLNKRVLKADTTKTGIVEQTLNPPSVTDLVSIPKIIWALLFIFSGYLIIRLIISILYRFSTKYPRYEFVIKRFIPIFRILAWIFIIYVVVVGFFNPPVATLVAFFASIGVAIGFAAQDLLKNIFGGFIVMFDRPFQIGDKIESGKYYGEVIEIGIRSTKIVTADDSTITIPNSEFMTQNVSNSNSGENNCQVVAEIYLPIDVNTEQVRKIATEAAQISKYIYLNKPINVVFINEMHEYKSVLKMRLKAYVSNLDKEFAFKSEMTEIVLKSLLEQGIIKPDSFSRNE